MSGGAEGAPGGIIGQATAGLSDPNFADFQVSGPSATSYQFDWKYNATLGAATRAPIPNPAIGGPHGGDAALYRPMIPNSGRPRPPRSLPELKKRIIT